MFIWRLFLVVQTVASSQFFAIRKNTSSVYTLFVRQCDSCDCYSEVDNPGVNLKLGNYTRDWYTDSQVTHRDARDLEWRCSVDGDLLYRNSASQDDQVWYDIKNTENIILINHKLDPCKNYIDIELALDSGQEVGASGDLIPCILMALTDNDPIKNDDYLFISSSRNGSHSHCRHQLLSSDDSLLLKVTPGSNLTILNEKCKFLPGKDQKGSLDSRIPGRKKQADDIRSPPSIWDRVSTGQTSVLTVSDNETSSGEKAQEDIFWRIKKEETSSGESKKKKHFSIAPGKKNWVLIGPICGTVGFFILCLIILTIFCWKKKREQMDKKRHTWQDVYFNVNSAQSSIRSKVDVPTSF